MALTFRFCVKLDKCPECECIWLDYCEIKKIDVNNNLGNELHEKNQSEKNKVCDGQDKGYSFYKNEYREDASLTRCLILNI